MSNRTIYDTLRAAGLTAEGACGLMGNMQAESTMKANIAQRGMTGMSDEQYTAAADNGQINFTDDSVGYGLCQWTYHTRKRALLAFARNCGVSVGDETMQVKFCLRELQQEYPMVMLTLCTSHDLYQCTADVCTKYECPAVNNIDARYRFAQEFYNEFCGSGALAAEHAAQTPVMQPTQLTDEQKAHFWDLKIAMIQLVMSADGYWSKDNLDGYKSAEFISALRQYTEDMSNC